MPFECQPYFPHLIASLRLLFHNSFLVCPISKPFHSIILLFSSALYQRTRSPFFAGCVRARLLSSPFTSRLSVWLVPSGVQPPRRVCRKNSTSSSTSTTYSEKQNEQRRLRGRGGGVKVRLERNPLHTRTHMRMAFSRYSFWVTDLRLSGADGNY